MFTQRAEQGPTWGAQVYVSNFSLALTVFEYLLSSGVPYTHTNPLHMESGSPSLVLAAFNVFSSPSHQLYRFPS